MIYKILLLLLAFIIIETLTEIIIFKIRAKERKKK